MLWMMSQNDHVPPTLKDFLPRPAWMALASCRGMGTAAWFPDRGGPTGPAKAVCAACPVRAACRDYTMAARTPMASGPAWLAPNGIGCAG